MPDENLNPVNTIPKLNSITPQQLSTINNFQRLWNDLSLWMRSFMVSLIGNADNLSATLNRMYVDVPLNFYNTFRVFYGEELAEQFHNLLSSFIVSAWRLAESFKSQDSTAKEASIIQLHQRADEIALFLASLNTNWDYIQWKSLFDRYIELWIEGLTAMTGKNYPREITIYDQLQQVAFHMGDYMARGIIVSEMDPNRVSQNQ